MSCPARRAFSRAHVALSPAMPPPRMAIRFMDALQTSRWDAFNVPASIIKLFPASALHATAQPDALLFASAVRSCYGCGLPLRMSYLELHQIVRFAARSGHLCLLRIRLVAAGYVDAAGLLGEDVSRDGVGAGAAASADVAKLAGAAFAVQLVGVAQLHEDG